MDLYRVYSFLSDALKIEPESLFNVFECIVLIWVLTFAFFMASTTSKVGAPDGGPEKWTVWSGRPWMLLKNVAAFLVVSRLLLHVVLLSYYWIHYYADSDNPKAAVLSFLGTFFVYILLLLPSAIAGGLWFFAFPVVAVAAFFVQGFFLNISDNYTALYIMYILLPLVCLMEAIVLACLPTVTKELREKTQKYRELAPQYEHYVPGALTQEGMELLEKTMRYLEQARTAQENNPNVQAYLAVPAPQPCYVERTNEDYWKELSQALNYGRRGIDITKYGVEYLVSKTKFLYDGNFDYAKAVPQVFGALNWNREPTADEYHELCRAIASYAYMLNQMLNETTQQMREELALDWEIIDRGRRGEEIAFEAAKQLTRYYPSVRILENYRIETEHGSAESDLVLITPAGVVCIEVKNYGEDGAYTLLIQNDGSWYKNYGSQVHPIEGNPFAQNAGHAAAIRSKFHEQLRAVGAKVLPLVMVPSNVMVENRSQNEVIHADTLIAWMEHQPEILTPEQIDRLWVLMKNHALPALAYRQKDYLGWQEMLDYYESQLQFLCELLPQIRPSEKYRNISL